MFLRWLDFSVWNISRPIANRLYLFTMEIAIYSLGVALLDRFLLDGQVDLPSNFHVLLGTVLGLLLVFRTNTAYDRWWEGRKLWGQLVNDSRNLAIKLQSHEKLEPFERQRVGRLLINFARALKEHLREGIRAKQLSVYRHLNTEPTNVPVHIGLMIREKIRSWRASGQIDGFDELLLDAHSRALMDVCGGCERIRRTRLVPSYLAFLHQTIILYLLTLPWAIVDQFSWWTVPVEAIIAYFMIGLELVAEDVEEPFGRTKDDILLDEICQGLEASLTEILAMPPKQSGTGIWALKPEELSRSNVATLNERAALAASASQELQGKEAAQDSGGQHEQGG